jgi:hypothetical protein
VDARNSGSIRKLDRGRAYGLDQYANADPQIEVVRSEIKALRAEMRQGFAELDLRVTKQIMELDHRAA